MKKAQAAMEFLMTYGWALLVVLIVIAALAFFGLLNPNRFLPEKCEIAPGLTCLDFSAVTNDTASSIFKVNYTDTAQGSFRDNITILLNNGLGTTIKEVSLNITECGNGTWHTSDGAGGGAVPMSGITGGTRGGMQNWSYVDTYAAAIAAGSTHKFRYPCGYMVPDTKFKSDMVITYKTVTDGNTLTHSKKGYIVVSVEGP